MTAPIRLPLHRWPLGWQCGLALAALVAVGLGALAWVRVSDAGVVALQRTLAQDTRTLDTRTLESTRPTGARCTLAGRRPMRCNGPLNMLLF